ncbi:hypothetical protein [Spiroplasma endosymbiont of Sarcophaga variegata]
MIFFISSRVFDKIKEDRWDVIVSYMQHYKINDILDLASDGWKILQIDQKIKGIV